MSFIFGYFLCPNNADLMATILPNDVNDRSNDLISSYLTDAGGMALDSHIDFLEFAVRKLENPSPLSTSGVICTETASPHSTLSLQTRGCESLSLASQMKTNRATEGRKVDDICPLFA